MFSRLSPRRRVLSNYFSDHISCMLPSLCYTTFSSGKLLTRLTLLPRSYDQPPEVLLDCEIAIHPGQVESSQSSNRYNAFATRIALSHPKRVSSSHIFASINASVTSNLDLITPVEHSIWEVCEMIHTGTGSEHISLTLRALGQFNVLFWSWTNTFR